MPATFNNPFNFTFDNDLLMKDLTAVTTSAAAQVAAAAKILDLGDGLVQAMLVLDVTAMDTTTGDEDYNIGWQLSTKADFADTIVEAAALFLGDATEINGDADLPAAVPQRFFLPVINWMEDIRYRYAQLFHTIAGTTPSITYEAWLAINHG